MTKCYFNGCDAHVDASDGWRCFFHRGRGRCSVQGCHNQAYARQLCARHGGKRQCRFTGCALRSRTGAYCTKHGSARAIRSCAHDGCSNAAQLRGLCVKHGGGRYCKMDGCKTFARTGGFCARHTRVLLESVHLAPHQSALDSKVLDLAFLELLDDEVMTNLPCVTFEEDGVDVDILDFILKF